MKHILLTINILLLGVFASAKTSLYDDSKTITKSIAVSSGFEMDITNKHGDINIQTWDKDSISIVVDIRVESQKIERLESMLNQINIRFSNQSDYLSVVTEWGSSSNGIRADLKRLFDAQSINVNYQVFVPTYIDLEIENRFGNIEMGNFDGKLKIELSHGNFTARNLKKAKTIKVEYGDLRIKNIEEGDIILKFSDATIKEADELDVESISSDLEIDKISSLKLKAKGGDVDIEEIEKLTIYASLSDIEIEKLTRSVSGEVKYGDFEIEEVVSSFENIILNAKSADVNIDFESAIAYSYYVSLEKGKSFSLPKEGNKPNEEATNDYQDNSAIHIHKGVFATVPLGGFPAKIEITSYASYIRFGIK